MNRLVFCILIVSPLVVILAGFAGVVPLSILELKVAGIPASIGIILVLMGWSVGLCWAYLRLENSGKSPP